MAISWILRKLAEARRMAKRTGKVIPDRLERYYKKENIILVQIDRAERTNDIEKLKKLKKSLEELRKNRPQ